MRSFGAILWDQFDEYYVLALLVLATISLVVSIFSVEYRDKWLEAVSIYFAILFAATIQTFCDWGKEKQFLRLQDEIMNETSTVLRGHQGTSQTIYSKDLVVGDIVLLNQGDRVPADCLLIDEMDMKVDQQQFFAEEYAETGDRADMADKQCSYGNAEEDKDHQPDPVLLQDSIVMRGYGKAVILAVGKHSLKEKEIAADMKADKYALSIEKDETPFQKKLRILSEIVGEYAYFLSKLCIVLFATVWIILVLSSDHSLVSAWSVQRGIDLLATVFALLIVCIPEGMPLVISMAMAFSVDSLQRENLLIKNLDALETSGQLIDIVTGKTATLTTGDMQATRIHICDRTFDATNIEANQEVLKYLWESMIMNSDAQMQMQGESYKPKGSPVDVGLLQLVSDQNIAVQDKLIERENQYDLKLWIPFSSDRKMMTTAYVLKDHPNTVRVFVKGAPEKIVPLCETKLVDQIVNFSGAHDDGHKYLDAVEREVIIGNDPAPHAKDEDGDNMNMKEPTGLKTITFAYRDFDKSDFEAKLHQYNKFEDEETRPVIESGLTLLASVGLSDTLREGIDEAIERLQRGGTNIRLFSGDHKASVMSTAAQLDLCTDM